VPILVLSAVLAASGLQAFLVQAALEMTAVAGRSFDEDFVERFPRICCAECLRACSIRIEVLR